jgi:hypothetical protein
MFICLPIPIYEPILVRLSSGALYLQILKRRECHFKKTKQLRFFNSLKLQNTVLKR